MKSDKLLLVILGVLLVITGCKKQDSFKVSGLITHAENQTIYLEELLVSSTKPVDSATVNSKGEFKLKGKAEMPTFYLLKFSDNKFITLLIDSVEKVKVQADFINFDTEYHVEGSLGSILVKELTMNLNRTRHKRDSLNRVYKMYVGSPVFETKKAELESEDTKVVNDQIEFSNKFVMSNPFSMASLYALYQKFNVDGQSYIITDLQPMRVAASALNSVYPKSEHVKLLYANTLQWLKSEQNAKLQKYIQDNGTNSPDIVLPDPYGSEKSLSSLLGKYVLVHFWAGANSGSRVINPVLAELYQKYKSRGFEIYQISLDQERSVWVDAIDQDKLSWINVSDLKGCNQAVAAYNIRSIPYNYLLDKKGTIIAKNLQGPELNKVLSGLFK